jgi:FAD/FMN-containing dehydrogenase
VTVTFETTQTASTIPDDALARLATDLDGTLVRPGDAGWDDARAAWQLAVDQQPAAVILAGSAHDVARSVTTARELGWHVAPQSTGHNAGPLHLGPDTLLLKTSALRGVHIDPVRCVARAEAGALWMDVTDAAAEHGLTALAGSSRDVGVAGYTLGGGLSWLARSHGLAANSVIALEVVTADGRRRHVDATHDPDLFWALRGGGGSYAVVTALEFRLYPLTEIYAGVLFWPIERARDVLQAWRAWLPSVPDTVTSVGRLLRFPPLPDLPAHLSGQAFVAIEAACQLDAGDAAQLLAPLRELRPAMDTFATIPTAELGRLHMDPDGPVPAHGDGMLIGELDEEGIDAMIAATGTGPSPLLSVELRQLGGALTPGRMPGGAVTGIAASFAGFFVGITPDAQSAAALRSAVTAVQHAMAPWSAHRRLLNFTERYAHGSTFFGVDVLERLRNVKAAYDPRDVIRANHAVAPPSGD